MDFAGSQGKEEYFNKNSPWTKSRGNSMNIMVLAAGRK